ncbi:YvrJ family protein [Bacillus sp. FJAT-44742]|uniref:YvrJ family protein n=1 Tax=Bacillus sp. FJAT-44742 TaxID=2014005 RepID=UPI000C23CB8E|nr:YvrJ family protein [Bacillus sp. FJAT-44742]
MLIHALANFGFPIIVSLFLLLRLEHRLLKWEAAMYELRADIRKEGDKKND